MASLLKLKTDIKKIKAAIASKATSGAIKTKLRGKLTTLENELDKLQPNKRKPKTTGPKSESALVRLAKKRRTNQGLSTSKSDIERDAIRPAKKAGKRTSANGNRYYEYRDNRVDNRQPPKKYRKLADGGYMEKGGKLSIDERLANVAKINKILQDKYVGKNIEGFDVMAAPEPIGLYFKNKTNDVVVEPKHIWLDPTRDNYNFLTLNAYFDEADVNFNSDNMFQVKRIDFVDVEGSAANIMEFFEDRLKHYAGYAPYKRKSTTKEEKIALDILENAWKAKGKESGITQAAYDKIKRKYWQGDKYIPRWLVIKYANSVKRDNQDLYKKGERDYMTEDEVLQAIADAFKLSVDGKDDTRLAILATHFGSKQDQELQRYIDGQVNDRYYLGLPPDLREQAIALYNRLLPKAIEKMAEKNIPFVYLNNLTDYKYVEDEYADGGMMAKGGKVKNAEWAVTIESEDGETYDWVGFAKSEDDAVYEAEQEAGFESVASGVNMITDEDGNKIQYKHGGKTQGYDDKKDESLGMTRGKLSLKDFVGNRAQKEHARRDDARFEERGKMDHGGYMAKGGDLSLIKKKYEENEDENAHSENVVLLAKHFGTKADLAKAKEILDLHEKEGFLSSENGKKRTELHYKLIDKARAEMGKQGIEFEKGGYMANGGKTKDQEVVRGYFEDEAYEYADGGKLRWNSVSIHISKNTEEDMRNAGFSFDAKGNAPLYYNGKEVGYLSNFNGVMLNDEFVDELVPMFNTFRDAGVWNYRGWKEEAEARKKQFGNKMADGGSVDYKLEVINQYSDEKLARIYSQLNDYDYSEILAEIKGDPAERKHIVSKIFKEVVERDNKMADGGSVAKGNYEMLMSQAKEVMHHAEELMKVAKPDMDVEAWVVAKAERATTDLSDITHYLDGLKMAMGGMVKHNAHKVNA